MQEILNSYLRKLTNLTARNKSILLLRLLSRGFVDLNDLDFLNNKPAFSIIEQLIARKKEIPLCKVIDSRDETNNKVSRKLKELWRFDRFVFEERGAKDLFIGWPFARGIFSDGTLVRAPLLFFPVSLEIKSNSWYLKSRTDEFCFINRSWLLAYAHFNGVPLEEQLMEANLEEFPMDSRSFRVALYDLFKNSNVELNFNQENFTDNLLPFQQFTREEFPQKAKTGGIKLHPEAVLGMFPQAGSYLVPDYLKLLNEESIEGLDSFFRDSKTTDTSQNAYLNVIKEENCITPFKMDAFQENALKAVKSGQSMVVQGPPGTGKSQLICNLISDYAAQGKRVLLVCQKRAALDVVHHRLQQAGMKPFTALVHDFKNDRRELYNQILQQIESLEEYKRRNSSLDAIQLERQFLKISRRIDQITEEFEEFKEALFDENEAGISVKQLYLEADLALPVINLKQSYKNFPWATALEFGQDLAVYHKYWERLELPDFPWRDRRSFKDMTINDLSRISELIHEIPKFANNLRSKVGEYLKAKVTFDDCEAFINQQEQIVELINLLKDEHVFSFFVRLVDFKDIEKDDLWLANMERVVMECFKNEGPESTLQPDELGGFQEVLQQKIESRKNIFKWLQWNLFSKEKMTYTRVLRANGLPTSREGLNILIEKTDNRLNLEHNLTKIRKYAWLSEIPDSYSAVDFQAWFYYQKKALKAKQIFREQRNFKEYFNLKKLTYQEFKSKLERLIKMMKDLPARKGQWLGHLMPAQIVKLVNGEPGHAEEMDRVLRKEFDNICAFDRLKYELDNTHKGVLEELYERWSDEEAYTIGDLFLNSVRTAWIDHIETKYPVLRMVSSLKLDDLQKEYQDLIKEKLQISQETLMLKLREKIYSDVRYNRLNNMISYRDLRHQVSKKRRIWPIRKLMAHFDEELFKLIPCWMASPESVSAITPMAQLFDLVIFDEASQCFAEKGIPAMYRGSQVVIAGDSKQLSPNDLYQIRWQEDEPDHIDLEVDSLLDLAINYLDQVHLQGHYRSQSLDLITFSNRHFYDNRLRMLPDFAVINSQEPGIEYIKVAGVWERNVNQNEAMEVVMLVEKLLKSHPQKSIGIVTFNIQQQQLIIECLEERLSQVEMAIPDSLMVKNIENVQGDEKDIIVFSVGYAPDQDGKFSMNFGSLNAEGGENRLNVAITRAREKIYVISSILPQDLRVAESKNSGPKLFQKYLQYAWEVAHSEVSFDDPGQQQHPISWYLKHHLKNQMPDSVDLSLEEHLPFADLTVRKQERYLGLILTDDNHYHQSISVKDSHVYLPLILTLKGWKFQGIFSRQYWMNPVEVGEQIQRFAFKERSSERGQQNSQNRRLGQVGE